jgi:benzoate 4-monooxygenase
VNGITDCCSDYYDAFVSIRAGIFNTRSRAAHARKRKLLSHAFSAKSINQFETYINASLAMLARQWDRIADTQKDSETGYAYLDSLHWCNFLAFDIIGDLAFGAPFGMLEAGRDETKMQRTPTDPVVSVAAIDVLNRRSEVSATLGCLPRLVPFAPYLPDRFFSKGLAAVRDLAGIATARVEERLSPEGQEKNTRRDMLTRLQEGRDENGLPMGRAELTAEAQTLMIAGSDTTSNTACALLYWCLRTQGVVETIQRELDAAVPEGAELPTFDMVKNLPL